ncbi:MAG: hypothetical protein EBR23_08325 [Planctomycetia bacterium]|nr:hypothetical protein [Planctomycetia bacterium]
MISTAPAHAASNLPEIADKIGAFIAVARIKARDGITVAEFGELTVALLRVAIAAADLLAVDGSRKKELVLEAVAALFDALADKAVPTLAWPVWLIVRPTVRQLVLLAAAGAIESLLPVVRIAT